MIKIFINLHCKMHCSSKAINTACKNEDSSVQGRVLKIDVTKNRFFLVYLIGIGYSAEDSLSW